MVRIELQRRREEKAFYIMSGDKETKFESSHIISNLRNLPLSLPPIPSHACSWGGSFSKVGV